MSGTSVAEAIHGDESDEDEAEETVADGTQEDPRT
jgi:tellurite resistance protein TerC